MLVTCIGSGKVRIGKPVFKSETLASELEFLLTTLEDDVYIVVGIDCGVKVTGRFTFVSPCLLYTSPSPRD